MLSPLLSNIVLDELDQELERRGHRFARYADDCNIYVRSRRAGERVMESVTRFIMAKLKLKVNSEKSAVERPWKRKFLGFSFTNAGIPKRRIAPKAVDRFRGRVRDITRRTRGVSTERMADELARYLRGWLGYFGKCETPSVLKSLEEWTRRRLRSAIWKQWKRGSVRFAALTARGVGKKPGCTNSGQRPWPVAAGELARPRDRAAQCVLRLTRNPEVNCLVLAQPAEPPDADPHVRWCDRESL